MRAMPLVDASDSVVCVVDVQLGFFAHSGLTEAERDRAAETVDRIAWLLRIAALTEVPAVVVEEGPERNGPTDDRVLDALGDGQVVHGRGAFSLAEEPEAVRALGDTRRRTAVVVGFETDVCVAQSAVQLVDAGYRVVVLDDATFAGGRQHERGLRRMASAGVEFNHCKGVVLEWLRDVDHARGVWAAAGRFPSD